MKFFSFFILLFLFSYSFSQNRTNQQSDGLEFGQNNIGIECDEDLLNKIAVFSDNVNNDLVIKNNNNQVIDKVEIYNLLGQKVKTWKNIETKFENRIPVNNLAASIYIVKVFTDKGIISKKVSISNN